VYMRKYEMKDRILPPIKWVGGKTNLLTQLLPLLPDNFDVYVEPFLGSGSMAFAVKSKVAILNDIVLDLMLLYKAIRDDLNSLIECINGFPDSYSFYYEISGWSWHPEYFGNLDYVTRAARFIYLNKRSFNGIYRVDSEGHFNVPWGDRFDEPIYNKEALVELRDYLKQSEVSLYCGDYESVSNSLQHNTFIYMSPPCYPLKENTFSEYTAEGFSLSEQVRLKNWCDKLNSNGILFMQSNSYCPMVAELYKGYNLHKVMSLRSVNPTAPGCGRIPEYAITNY